MNTPSKASLKNVLYTRKYMLNYDNKGERSSYKLHQKTIKWMKGEGREIKSKEYRQ